MFVKRRISVVLIELGGKDLRSWHMRKDRKSQIIEWLFQGVYGERHLLQELPFLLQILELQH